MKYIVILSLFCFLFIHAKKNKTVKCSEYIRKLTNAEKEFMGCTVESSVPVSFCEYCKSQHDTLLESYNMFATANDTKTNESCKSIYFDRDRMNIVETVYEQLNGLWNKGFCSECWSDFNDTENMLNHLTNFEDCLLMYPRTPCISCKNFYIEINNMYENFEKKHKGKVCFDIQDKMNRSRVLWSKDLKCCKREANLTAYSSVSGSLIFLVILFYGAMIVLTKRSERNHETIDNRTGDDETPPNSNRNAETSRNLPTRVGGSEGSRNSSQPDLRKEEINRNKISGLESKNEKGDKDPSTSSSYKIPKKKKQHSKSDSEDEPLLLGPSATDNEILVKL